MFVGLAMRMRCASSGVNDVPASSRPGFDHRPPVSPVGEKSRRAEPALYSKSGYCRPLRTEGVAPTTTSLPPSPVQNVSVNMRSGWSTFSIVVSSPPSRSRMWSWRSLIQRFSAGGMCPRFSCTFQ
ncbi:MAG: hypothetical protein U0470_12390 [Anaerolineae bacterium]